MKSNKIIYQVDSFSAVAFKGNPAGVMILESEMTEEDMQNIAMEMNLSETAFVVHKDSVFHIRYFTPTSEVPICGHATLASAHVLYSQEIVDSESTITFVAKVGTLKAKKSNDLVTIDLPMLSYKTEKLSEWKINPFDKPIVEYYTGDLEWNVIVMNSEEDVRTTKPDFSMMVANNISHTLLTAQSTAGTDYDFVVRCFAPNKGINEDPVTGSAQCLLAPLWSEKLAKTKFVSKQLSNRSGILYSEIVGNRVLVSGAVKTVFKIELV